MCFLGSSPSMFSDAYPPYVIAPLPPYETQPVIGAPLERVNNNIICYTICFYYGLYFMDILFSPLLLATVFYLAVYTTYFVFTTFV